VCGSLTVFVLLLLFAQVPLLTATVVFGIAAVVCCMSATKPLANASVACWLQLPEKTSVIVICAVTCVTSGSGADVVTCTQLLAVLHLPLVHLARGVPLGPCSYPVLHWPLQLLPLAAGRLQLYSVLLAVG
jgi:hypothetical protein